MAKIAELKKLLVDVVDSLAPERVDYWLGSPVELKKLLAGEVQPVASDPLLKLVGTIAVPATTGQFIVKDHFVRDVSPEAKVKISYLSPNFTKWFLGKIEDPIPQITLHVHAL